MDAARAKRHFIETRNKHAERLEDLENLPRNVDDKAFLKVFHAERVAWFHFAAARKGLREAVLQSLGR